MNSRDIFQESILHFLAPVRRYLQDPEVAEIMINGPHQIYIERHGRLELTDASFPNEESVVAALRNMAQFCGKLIDDYTPILEARLPDGSRIQGVLRPVATSGPYIAIRRFFQSRLTLDHLLLSGSLSPTSAEFLKIVVQGKLNIAVSGGTGTGKTSLLNLLTTFIPEGERIGVLEDSKEVQVQRDHVFQLETRRGDADAGVDPITMRDLFRASLRMRPDRIIIGEIRGGEALDIVQAMVSGHGGCMCTLHASCPEDALLRLETMAMMSQVKLPLSALRSQIASGIDVIVQVTRELDGRRLVTHISEVIGYDQKNDCFETADIFRRHYDEASHTDELLPTGVAPRFEEKLRAHGVSLPDDMKQQPSAPLPPNPSLSTS